MKSFFQGQRDVMAKRKKQIFLFQPQKKSEIHLGERGAAAVVCPPFPHHPTLTTPSAQVTAPNAPKDMPRPRTLHHFPPTVVSQGVVAWVRDPQTSKRMYIMIRPRSSYGFVSIILGLWSSENQLRELVAKTTEYERKQLTDVSKWQFDNVLRDTCFSMGVRSEARMRSLFDDNRELFCRLVAEQRAEEARSGTGAFRIPLALPKGRREPADNADVHATATREFREETTLRGEIRFENGVTAHEETAWRYRRWRAEYHLGEYIPADREVDRGTGELIVPQPRALRAGPMYRPTVSGEADEVLVLTLEQAIAQTNERRGAILRAFDTFMAQSDSIVESITVPLPLSPIAADEEWRTPGRNGSHTRRQRPSRPNRGQAGISSLHTSSSTNKQAPVEAEACENTNPDGKPGNDHIIPSAVARRTCIIRERIGGIADHPFIHRRFKHRIVDCDGTANTVFAVSAA